MVKALAQGALTAVLLASAFSPVSASEELTRVELAGTTVVTGSESAFVPVRIPVSVELSAISDFSTTEQTPNPDIEIAGAGRVFGMVLTQNGPERLREDDVNDGATLSATRYGMCSGAGCEPLRDGVDVVIAFGPGVEAQGERGTSEHYVLPAGNYNLYLLADGAPVSVTIRLHGLSGSTTLTPSTPADMHLSEATSQDSHGIEYRATDEHAFEGLGMIVVAMMTRSSVASFPQGGHCIVRQPAEPAPTDPADGWSFCTSRLPGSIVAQWTGDDPGNFHGSNPGRGGVCDCDYPSGRVVFRSSFDPGLYRISQHYTTTPLDNSRGFIALWLAWS